MLAIHSLSVNCVCVCVCVFGRRGSGIFKNGGFPHVGAVAFEMGRGLNPSTNYVLYLDLLALILFTLITRKNWNVKTLVLSFCHLKEKLKSNLFTKVLNMILLKDFLVETIKGMLPNFVNKF